MEDSKSASTKRQNLLPTTNGGQYVRAAYFTNWSTRLTGRARYEPKKHYLIGLCTHIHYAFATINNDNTVSASEPYDLIGLEKTSNNTMEESFGLYERVNGLKLFDDGLKTLISIGNRERDTEPFKKRIGTIIISLLSFRLYRRCCRWLREAL
ncbi:hypothetical protein AB6A40_002575 [Gnathostoma spinigerum]|uniref:GH18 domain-containing protein n=1 Tax=Gnathostoma spinigerum TaxID=75299 RepID=A0ABD6EEN4_9BILA